MAWAIISMTTTALSQTLWFLGPEASPRGGERGNQDHSGKSWEAWDECWVNIIAQANRVNGITGRNADQAASYERDFESTQQGNRKHPDASFEIALPACSEFRNLARQLLQGRFGSTRWHIHDSRG